MAALAACGSTSASPQGGRDKQTTTSTTLSSKQQVLHGYAAAIQAIADAELHNDPQWPALMATVVNPELSHVQAFIATEVHLSYHSQGVVQVISSKVVSYSPTQAAVQACVHDQVVAYQANGSPVPGNAGTATYDLATGTLIPAGNSWVLQDGTDRQFATAQQAGPSCAG